MNKFCDTCWECRNLCSSPDWRNEDVNGMRREIRCDSLHYGVNPFDRKCSRFENGHYSDDYIQRCVDAFYKKCNYYIVSACMAISKMPNASVYLDAFKDSTENDINTSEVVSMLSRLGYTPDSLLDDYELYGKMVADSLYDAYSNSITKNITTDYVENSIIPKLSELLEKKQTGNTRACVLGYIKLTRDLMKKFSIEPQKLHENAFSRQRV